MRGRQSNKSRQSSRNDDLLNAKPKPMNENKPLSDRIALVTGATRGLGFQIAVQLAKAGAHVIATGRVVGALEELDDAIHDAGGSATLVPLDLMKADMIDQLGPTIFNRWGKLDIFVANAAILGPLSPLGHITANAWQRVIDINLNANWRLLRTLDPLLMRSDAARVLFITSGAASGNNAYWGPYAVSKAGLEALARSYAAEKANTAVRTNILNPGAMRTQMRAKAFPGEDPMTLPDPAEVAPLAVELVSPACDRNGETILFRQWKSEQTRQPENISQAK